MFTETWLNSSIADGEFIDSRYVVYRRDRQSSKSSKSEGGGVMIAVSRDIVSARVHNWETDLEDLWVTLKIKNGNSTTSFAICAVYLPPPAKLETQQQFLNNADLVLSHVDNAIVLGDFNLNFINWTPRANCSYMMPSNYNKTLGYSLIDFMSLNNLYQFNNILNADGKMLDLVLTNSESSFVTKPNSSLCKIDPHHPSLLLCIPQTNSGDTSNLTPSTSESLNFHKANYNDIVSELDNCDWTNIFKDCNNDVNLMVSAFYKILEGIIGNFVPKRKVKSHKHPIWFTKEFIKLLKEKDNARKRFHKYKNPRDKFEFNLLRDRCNKLYDLCYSNYMKSMENNICIDPKMFWRYIKDKRKGLSGIPSIMYMDNLSANSGTDIANLFASHFSSIYNSSLPLDSSNSIATNSNPNDVHHLSQITLTGFDIFKAINKLDPCKGAGPDNIPPLFVKRTRSVIVQPLLMIFNCSLHTGLFPTEWKKARIVPVHKKDDKSNVKNYRPISILSCFSKLLESLIYPHIYNLINYKLTDFQHGFRSGRSVDTNLAVFVSDLSSAVDQKLQVDTIYTDFSSAFDKVDHKILISKLKLHGIDYTLLNWFDSYLSQRPQSVVINGFESRLFVARSGVPQGSHLGPILFLVFINDIVTYIKTSSVSLFADDLKIYKTINGMDDAISLQRDLDGIETWCKINNMSLNPVKCYQISFTRQKKPLNFPYSLNGTVLAKVEDIRDLGITLSSNLKFTAHLNNKIKKAAQMLGFLKRSTRDFRLPRTKLILYNSLVRSHLEYGSVAWNPVYSEPSQRVESIQRAFTRHLAYFSRGISHFHPYDERLNFFKMSSLRCRRSVTDLTFLYKVINNKIKCQSLRSQIGLNVPCKYPRNRITKTFNLPFFRTNLGLHSPIPRMCSKYNEITNTSPDIDIFFDSFTVFKKKVLKQSK